MLETMRMAFVLVSVAAAAAGQVYTISTFAGGALPVNISGTSASLKVGFVATDPVGSLYFVDQNYVLRLDAATGLLTRVAGDGTTGFGGDGGPATSAQLRFPVGIALDAAGDIFIADWGNNRVRAVTNGTITTVAGNGSAGYGGDGGPAVSARLSAPEDVAVDSSGNLYIADTMNNRVRKVSKGVITTVAGTGIEGFSGDGGPATSAQLSAYAVAVDPTGALYITDTTNQRVRRVANGVITTIAGNGMSGFSGDGGPATAAELNNPFGLAADPAGNVYVADVGNNRVREIANGVITTIAGKGAQGLAGDDGPAVAAELSSPESVALDSRGNVYVADVYNDRIRKISGGTIVTVAGGGTFVGVNGAPTAAQLGSPSGMAIDSLGNVYFADAGANSVWMVAGGQITEVAGDGLQGFGGDNGPATSAMLNGPGGIAVDLAGNLYIADCNNNRVRKVANGIITTVAGNGLAGFDGDNGPAASAQLNLPLGLAVDSSNSLYIADNNNNRVRRVTNGIITTVAGNGGVGLSGDGGPATAAQVSGPSAVAIDANGGLYITEVLEGSRVRKVANGTITTIAGGATQGFGGDGGPATGAQLLTPQGVAVDSAANIYISDTNNQRVRKIANGVLTTVAGNGTRGFTGDGGMAYSAELSYPQGLAVDPVGNVYVADAGNSRVRVLAPAGVPSINAGGAVNSASLMRGQPVAPGSLASVYGTFLTGGLQAAQSVPLPTELGNLSLRFDVTAAPLLAVTGNQVNFQVPWELAGMSQTSISVAVDGQISAPQAMMLSTFAPGIFSTNGTGGGQGAILDAQYRLVDSSNPAVAGLSVIQIYCTGLGPVTNQPPTGSPALAGLLAETTATPMVTIGGAQAQVLFSGLAPDSIGVYQVNALVPQNSASGAAVPVVIAFGSSLTPNGVLAGGATSNEVTIAVR